jgi:23S rRNA (cytosine1962-C5)-methyltransferase
MTRVTLRRGRAKPLWFGHPWIYSEAIAQTEGEPAPGSEVAVHDHEGRFVGRGLISPQSQIRVRLFTRRDEPLDDAFFARRIASAAALRRQLGLPDAATDAYRLINSEGDGLPGLTVDAYGDALVVQFGTIGMWTRQGALVDALAAELKPRTIYASAGSSFAAIEGFAVAPQVLRGEERATVTCREHGVVQEVAPLQAQKTGLFLDQRENRARLATLCRDARVLDVYTYHGGFALAALKGGAAQVTAVDISPRALEQAQANARLNGFTELKTVEADAFRYLEAAPPRAVDVCVIDPPKFARARKDLEAALKGYRRLNALALGVVAAGGLLVTCSCSQQVDAEAFERVLAGSAQDARRRLQILEVRSMGADHPLPPGFPEGRYLKCVFARVTDE